MTSELLSLILPQGLLEYFTITKISELDDNVDGGKKVQIELEEKNKLPLGYAVNEYETKDFYPVKIIQDFPIRGKALYLAIKRRRWRHKINKNEVIHNDYSQFAEGSKLTQELSDFLKATGRDPRRYG
jgi:hypothetical protein